ncbi:zinc ribbon-containing protein [Inmirania thermothiophila]|uniref:Zinc ribbon family protein n=1 Tax=Inmirania thermothiophila TaxID=1750597 RepID=A0A3N1Y8C7_9GAMM|nr:zinc ribbon-containing protein [Inmirania thermothiophila]ROR34748.1 zinc ribbon family protein [Inmirania thermothiophila]
MSGEGREPDRLGTAYHRMVERVRGMLERAEHETAPTLRQLLERAKERAVELGELTREEAEELADYVRRDLQHAARYVAETGRGLADWLRFDLQYLEERLAEMLPLVVDRTRLELERLAEQAREATVWHTGEVTGPGTLVCTACGETLQFRRAGRIPPCPRCHGTRFRRPDDEDGVEADGG